MKKQYSGSDLAYASRLHKISLAQAKKSAIKAGWQADFVNEVANLEWGKPALDLAIKQDKASTDQANAIFEVYNTSKLLLAGKFALSQS